MPTVYCGKAGMIGNVEVNLGKLFVAVNGKINNKMWYEFYSKNQHTKTTIDMPISCRFNSIKATKNFIDSTQNLLPIRYFYQRVFLNIDRLTANKVFWLGNIENPRTHKIGYESDWTNQDLCNVFKLTGYVSDTESVPKSDWDEILSYFNCLSTKDA